MVRQVTSIEKQIRQAKTHEEIRPLVKFCKAGRLPEVQAWIAAGKPLELPPPPPKGNRGKSPLKVAVERGFYTLVEVLLQGGAVVEMGWKCPMNIALGMRRLDIVKLLVEYGGDPRSVSTREVFDTWDPEIMEYFIEKGADAEAGNPLASALIDRIRTALSILKRYKGRFPCFQEQANIALRHHCKEGNMKWISLMLWAGADPYAQGTNDPREELHPNEDGLSALGFAALSGHFEVFDFKGLRLDLDVKHPALKEMMSDAYKPGGEKILKRLLAMGMEPNDQENGGCSAIQSLLEHMNWTCGRWPGREPEGSIDTGEARQKMKIAHILARHGARWIPKDKREVKRARRSLLQLKPDYTVEYVWIMSKYKACTLDSIRELLRPSRIRSHVSGHSQRVQELLASWS